jgi:hypothetical protein
MNHMRNLVMVFVITLVWGGSYAQSPGDARCEGGDLSKADLKEIVKAEIKRRGGNPGTMQTNTRMDISSSGCDYLVRLTFLPETPGVWTVYRVSRARKTVEVVPGE